MAKLKAAFKKYLNPHSFYFVHDFFMCKDDI